MAPRFGSPSALAELNAAEIGATTAQVRDALEHFAAAFGRDLVHGRRLDLWTAAERALEAAGVAEVTRTDLCTHCNADRFFSHRRTGKPRGVQGVIARVA